MCCCNCSPICSDRQSLAALGGFRAGLVLAGCSRGTRRLFASIREGSEKVRFSFQEKRGLTGRRTDSAMNSRWHAGLRFPAIVKMCVRAGNPVAGSELERDENSTDTLDKEQCSGYASSRGDCAGGYRNTLEKQRGEGRSAAGWLRGECPGLVSCQNIAGIPTVWK